jgi:hypothetical protein
MTVGQLIELLKEHPSDTDVYAATECCGCWEPVKRVYLDERGMVVVTGGYQEI